MPQHVDVSSIQAIKTSFNRRVAFPFDIDEVFKIAWHFRIQPCRCILLPVKGCNRHCTQAQRFFVCGNFYARPIKPMNANSIIYTLLPVIIKFQRCSAPFLLHSRTLNHYATISSPFVNNSYKTVQNRAFKEQQQYDFVFYCDKIKINVYGSKWCMLQFCNSHLNMEARLSKRKDGTSCILESWAERFIPFLHFTFQ